MTFDHVRLREIQAAYRTADKRKITNVDIAKATGMSSTTVGNWMEGRHKPRLESAAIIAKLFGVNMEELVKA